MAQKKIKKKVKAKKKEVYQPLYVQSSNPDQSLLDWIAEMGETRIVYLQSGKPAGGGCVPGQAGCQ